jgi:DNA-binding protein Fis
VLEKKTTFTLTISAGTPMRQIQDLAINEVLKLTGNNRVRTAELLDINLRTIRRRLGRKHASRTLEQSGTF